jgi:hypothetical protein
LSRYGICRRDGGIRIAHRGLAAVPDLRPSLRAAEPDELADLFRAFDVKVTFDKANRRLTLAATITPELVPQNEKPRRPEGRSGNSLIAGAGFEPATFGL